MMSTINEYTQAREGGDAQPRGERQAIFCPIFQKKRLEMKNIGLPMPPAMSSTFLERQMLSVFILQPSIKYSKY